MKERSYYIILILSGIIMVILISLTIYWQAESARINREVSEETLRLLIDALEYMENRK